MSGPNMGAAQSQPANRKQNPDGSEIFFDRNGVIAATNDVLGERREYAIEPRTGKLMVKRFGLWTKPEQARIDQEGNLYFRRGDLEVLERLDGVHIQANKTKGVTIKNDQKNKIEVIEMANGEAWKRHTTDEVERFWIWKNTQPSFQSETYFKPGRCNARTPSGTQALSYVSRHEYSYEKGDVVREKFSFNNEQTNERYVAVALQIGRGMLMLRNVVSVTTFFGDGEPTETTYKLHQPTSLKIDIPVMKATFEKITDVRSFVDKSSASMAFRDSDSKEQILKLTDA